MLLTNRDTAAVSVKSNKLSSFSCGKQLEFTISVFCFFSLCSGLLSCSFCVNACVFVYLLDILLEHTQLQPLVQSDLSMLPNILETPLMVEDLVNHIQDAMYLRKFEV